MYQLVRGELRTGIYPHFMRHVQNLENLLFLYWHTLMSWKLEGSQLPSGLQNNSIYELFQGHIHKKANAAQAKLIHRWKRGFSWSKLVLTQFIIW